MPDNNKPDAAAAATTPLSAELADQIASQVAEYGTYVANRPIDANGVRAYNTGDPVPVSNVKAHGYDKVPTGEGAKTESWVDKA